MSGRLPNGNELRWCGQPTVQGRVDRRHGVLLGQDGAQIHGRAGRARDKDTTERDAVFGRELGRYATEEFVNRKMIRIGG